MGLVVDKLSGQIFLFDFTGGGSTGYTGAYPEVETFGDLPLPVSAATQIRVVRTSSGAYLINRKEAGLYYSNGASWRRLGDIPSFFDDDNFEIYDGDDNTKRVKFQASNITSNTIRSVTFQDTDGTIAFLADVNVKLDKTTFNTYTGTTAPGLYLSKTAFNTYTGTTAPGLYLTKTAFNTYSALTKTDIESRLLKAMFDVYSANTASIVNGKLNTSDFVVYSALTLTNINSRLLKSDFNTYSGLTLTNIQSRLLISNFNAYSALTLTNIQSRLLTSLFNAYSASTLGDIQSRLLTSNFNAYSAVTLTDIQSRLLKNDFNIYSASTLTNIQSRLLTSNFNAYSALTLSDIQSRLLKSDFNSYSGLTFGNIQSRLLTSFFNTYSGLTLTDIQSRLLKSDFNTYSGLTLANIQSRLLSSIFNAYTANTETKFNLYTTKIKFNSYTANTETNFNTYTANTETRLDQIENDLSYISGITASTGLQQVTEIGATTTVESTFNGGLVTNHIRPTGDTITGIQITKADGITPVINVDTVSGLTGFGEVAPKGLVHAYGRDNSEGEINTQTNALIIDGDTDVDKDIAWFDNGVPKWLGETYRGEDGEFWYLYNVEADNSPLTIARSGEVGINTPVNILSYHAAQKEGSGLNDLVTSGVYTENFNTVYQVRIESTTGVTDQYVWRKSIDEGNLFTPYSSVSGVTTTPVLLENGVYINFINLTGHTAGDVLQFIAFTQIPQATLSVSSFPVNEIIVTNDYTAPIVEYVNQTGTLNGGLDLPSVSIFATGSTGGALLLGFTVRAHGVAMNVDSPGLGLTLVAEYFDPTMSGWTAINITNNHLVDNTINLTRSGRIIWNPYTFINWNLAPIFEGINSPYDELYWIRLRTVSPPVVSPKLTNISVGSDKTFSVYSTSEDVRPKFYVDSLGRTNIGGGSITSRNILQINSNRFAAPTSTASDSLVEIDSEDSSAIDLKIKLVSNDDKAPGLTFFKGRGLLSATTGVQSGDTLFRIDGRGSVGIFGRYLSQISSTYIGDGTTRIGDLRFSTANGGEVVERVRVNHIGTGFGVSPTARIDIQSGSTTIAPARFRNGSLLSIPIVGAFEFSNDNWFGTPVDGVRRRFAFLESPNFVGVVGLPSGTTLDGVNLINRINISGGTNNPNLVKIGNFNSYTATTENRIVGIEDDIVYISGISDTKLDITDFNTYTGSTIPWARVSKVGSNLNEFQTRNAVDVNNTITEWSSTNVSDILGKVTNYMEDTQGSGRIFPENVLNGRFTPILNVSAGTGYINYSGLHKIVSWTPTTFSGFSVQSLNYVYVDVNGTVLISQSAPSETQNILLGSFYFARTSIGTIKQSGTIINSTYNRISDFTSRMGLFIYDNGGLVSVYTGNTLGLYSAPMKVQNGFLSTQNGELSTANASTNGFLNYYKNVDLDWVVNYYFNYGYHGLIPVNRWNDITKTGSTILSGHNVTFTAGSKIVTSTSNLTSLITTNDFICKSSDTRRWLNPVSAITWNGSQTIINLESIYSGTTGVGLALVDNSLPRIGTKFAKHLIIRTPDNSMAVILGQTTYNDYNDAKNGVLPSIPSQIESLHLKMAYLVVSSGTTDLSGQIFDIRPLPFTYREGGQAGGGGGITVHGQLSGLGADDHLQYLRTDGARSLTGIQRYTTHPTFTSNEDIVDKKYVDDANVVKLNISIFNGYTGSTAPSTYLSIANFNVYSAATLTNINTRLLKTTFNTFTGSTAPSTYLSIGNFNVYSAATLTNINTRLLRSTFNTFTGSTAPSTYLSIANFNIYSGTTIPTNYYNKLQINAYSAFTDTVKANLNSPAFTGVPTVPTAAANSNTGQIANTAFVVGQAGTANPLINGAVAIGTSLRYAREDHAHPTDTTRLAVSLFNSYTGSSASILSTSVTGGTSLGGVAIFSDKTGRNLRFKGLVGGTNITLTPSSTGVTVSAPNVVTNTTFGAYTASTRTQQIILISTGNTDINQVLATSIPFHVQRRYDTTHFLFTGGTNIRILTAGVYEVSYHINVLSATAAAKSVAANVYVNGAINNNTLASTYLQNASALASMSLPPIEVTFAANALVTLRGYRILNAGAANIVPNSVFISIRKKV